MSRNQIPYLSQLADYLYSHKEDVINRWIEAVDYNPKIETADHLTKKQLLDHLPDLFDEMCNLLHQDNSPEIKTEIKHDSQIHGRHRWLQGYRLDELLREIEIIRRIVLVEWVTNFGQQESNFKGQIKKRAKEIIHSFFANLTLNSVTQFVQDRETELLDYNRKLQESNEKLRQVDDSRLRFTRTLSHELRNILHPMNTAIKLLGEELDTSTKDKILEIFIRKIRDMTTLTNQLLDFANLLAGQQQVEWQVLEIRSIFDESVSSYETIAKSKGLDFQTHFNLEVESIETDQLKLKQVISNLLSNALKYTEQGSVCLSFHSADSENLSIYVEDTGAGISPEDLTHLFEEFHRSSATAHVPGTGLGLAITKRLVELLNGRIQVESEIGKGSRFEVILPISRNSVGSRQ
jgi:signal transduction histidine kinase